MIDTGGLGLGICAAGRLYFPHNNVTGVPALQRYKMLNGSQRHMRHPGKYNIFFIKEPKLRLVMSQNMIDKLINHVVSKYFLVNVFESSLIDTNVATRVNKGSGYGILKLKEYIHNLSFKYNQFYYLKFDIKKYFFNIDHEILKKLLRKKIADRDALELLDRIIDSTDYDYINQRIRIT